MDKKLWHGYAKYLVLADDSNGELKANYENYLNFKQIKDVINNIAYADKSTYSYEGDIYTRKITSADAKTILSNISDCKWNQKTSLMLLVASQLKLRI